jgi:long-chain acyl-CoA synthetase
MTPIRDFFTRLFKPKKKNEPWLSYYSEEEKKIKFTDKTIYEYLKESVGEDTDYVALNYFGTRISFNEMFLKIDQASRSLRSMGVKPGDIVTICMPNTPEAIIAFYACNNIGAVADMVHPLSSEEQIKLYLNESKSRVLIMLDSNYDRYKNVLPDTMVYKTIFVSPKESMPPIFSIGYQITRGFKVKRPHFSDIDYLTWKEFLLRGASYNKPFTNNMKSKDLAVILHSGGTTGQPKGIMLSNYNFNAETQQGGVNVINVRPRDKILTILPIFHGFGLNVCIHCPLCLKVEVILMPEYDGNRFYKIMKNLKPNVLAGVPTLWEGMLNNKKFDDVDMSELKYIISGGDYLTVPMEKKMNNFLHRHGAHINISKGYGMTESVAATAYTFDGTNEPGSIGIPMIGNSFTICNPDTNDVLPFGEEGEICVNGPTVMMGYLNKKEETKHVLRRHSDGKTWLHTGDLGYISPDGIIFFTGRLKRMIVTSGFNVYPNIIEEVIEKHPDVAKCCVIGVPHPYKMHVPKAFIVLEDDRKPTLQIKKEIKDLCKKNLAVYSIPKDYEFRKSLPKTLYGKVDFKQLEKEEEEKNNK